MSFAVRIELFYKVMEFQLRQVALWFTIAFHKIPRVSTGFLNVTQRYQYRYCNHKSEDNKRNCSID